MTTHHKESMTAYEKFLLRKERSIEVAGVEPGELASILYPFQADIVKWAVRLGRAAIFADCGMGKTLMQLEWARHFGRVLIVAPIAVAEQTIAEGAKIGIDVRRVLEPDDGDGITITNYERLHKFAGRDYGGIVLDESSILKSVDGKTRTMLLKEFTSIPRRLCCTATPAPNDVTELANHAEFLGAMSRSEMLATFFVHDSDASGNNGWRLKGHAAEAMWKWMARWSCFIRRPSDLGYEDESFVLPALTVTDEPVRTDYHKEGELFATVGGVGDRAKVRRHTLAARVERVAELVRADPDNQWIVWCGLNDEGRALARALGDDAALVEGSDDDDTKIAREREWRAGRVRVLITKPSMFGFGMNWQHCARVAFLGLGDSYEQYYQAIRRCWRFGQHRPVDVRIVVSEAEGAIAANVRHKEQEAQKMAEGVIGAVRDAQMDAVRGTHKQASTYGTDEATDASGAWRMLLGDCVERIREIDTGSVGMSVYSPPFASLYTYSASDRDMGNSRDYASFFEHYAFLVKELLRVTMPGRRTCCHCQQVSTTKATHGVIGWRDFRGDLIRAYQARGWVYDGEVVIDKDPQAQAIRTKSKALMFVQKERDASWLRPAMADYILLFCAPGENTVPVKSDVNNEEWILWARPIWYNISETDTLQYMNAREEQDEKHICPLQLGTIERCVRLWSNPGEVVFSPFGGIGSEGFVAVRNGRKYIGIELKPSYWRAAVRHLKMATAQQSFGFATVRPAEVA